MSSRVIKITFARVVLPFHDIFNNTFFFIIQEWIYIGEIVYEEKLLHIILLCFKWQSQEKMNKDLEMFKIKSLFLLDKYLSYLIRVNWSSLLPVER